jgi:membrane protein
VISFIKKVVNAFWDSVRSLIRHDGVEQSGYLSFLTMLSVFPMMVLFVAITGQIGKLEVGQRFVRKLITTIPDEFVGDILPRISEVVSSPPPKLLSLAIVGIIWSSSSVLEGLRTVLNRAYRVHTPPSYFIRRLISLGQIILFTSICTIAMMLIVIEPFIARKFGDIYNAKYNYNVAIGLLFFGVVAVYYILPNVKQKLINVIPGAVCVVIGWIVTAEALKVYLHINNLGSIYGSLAGVILTLIFFYLDFIILIFGAEFNYALDKAFNITIEEKDAKK